MHGQIPVHVGYPPPRESPTETGDVPRRVNDQVRVSALDGAPVDWEGRGVEPRWVGFETADCVAALQPNSFESRGADELRRFLAGTVDRGETALLVSMVGFAVDNTRSIFGGSGESLHLGHVNMSNMLSATRLPARARIQLAPDLAPAERDLGQRLLNRLVDAPWWELELQGITTQHISGPVETAIPSGELHPILVGPLGAPVVAVWVAPDERTRWYILPDDINWNVVLDWLVHQALPAYVPQAMRRLRTSSFVDPDLRTAAEVEAQQALAEMETRHAEERARLEAVLAEARQEADEVRDGLFHGTGDGLVRAVESVLIDAGFDVVDLDVLLGGTVSADLLVSLGAHRRLVEVKSQGRNASESLVDDLLRHLRTWPDLRPELAVGGGALIVNHQHRLPPDQRSAKVYTRAEFVNTLTVPVISVRSLFDWWRTSDRGAIQSAVLGMQPPDPTPAGPAIPAPAPGTAAPHDEPRPKPPRRWFGFWRGN